MNLLQKLFQINNILSEIKESISDIIDMLPEVEFYLISNFINIQKNIKQVFFKIVEVLKSVQDILQDLIRYTSSVDITERTEDFYNKDLPVYLSDAEKKTQSIKVNQLWNYCKDRIISIHPEIASESDKLFAYSYINYFYFAIPEWAFPVSVTVELDGHETFTVPL